VGARATGCDLVRMTTDQQQLRELDHRVNDGIDVRLLWRPADDRVLVAVEDALTGEAFTIEVRPGQRPLDVFHHPYAYAPDPRAGDELAGARP
jgi:hypothetical protein